MPAMLSNTDPALRRFWHPVCLETDVPAAGLHPVRLLGEAWVLARLGDDLVALRDLCPHRLVPLSAGRVDGSELECGYHGYRFDATGRVTAIPALGPGSPLPPKACVPTAQVACRFGLVWLCLADHPLDDILDDTAYRDPAHDLFVAGPFATPVSAGILTDNFIDCGHFPFLHRDTFGGADDGKPVLRIEREGWRVRQTTVQMVGGSHLPQPASHHATYEIGVPFSVELALGRGDGGDTDYVWSFVCPAEEHRSVWYMVHAYPLGGDAELIAAATDLQTRVGLEDLAMLERMEDPRLPVDVRLEVHTKADAGCLEYRRVCREVLAGGPAGPPPPAATAGADRLAEVGR